MFLQRTCLQIIAVHTLIANKFVQFGLIPIFCLYLSLFGSSTSRHLPAGGKKVNFKKLACLCAQLSQAMVTAQHGHLTGPVCPSIHAQEDNWLSNQSMFDAVTLWTMKEKNVQVQCVSPGLRTPISYNFSQTNMFKCI